MVVSRYFSEHQNSEEQGLINDLVVETIMQRGYDLKYSPRAFTSEDSLFGEDGSSVFQSAITLEMVVDAVEGFGGEGDFDARMGLDIRVTISFVVSKTRFKETVTRSYSTVIRPMEGDLILFSIGRPKRSANKNWHVFEITFVEHEKEFYSLGSNYTYEIQAKRFEYSHEIMDTGVTDIDEIESFIQDNDNETLETDADAIIDFSEEDPFSEGNY